MMYGYGWGGGEAALAGPDLLGILTWIVVIVDLILLGFWLWKQIKKN
ncbi:MAG: hypothetical protein KGI73_03360 [Patescibacteria group bacterium]|nr:hypothetical protein [Patescibacteria group bacterium]